MAVADFEKAEGGAGDGSFEPDRRDHRASARRGRAARDERRGYGFAVFNGGGLAHHLRAGAGGDVAVGASGRVAAVEGLAESAHAATDDVGVREAKQRLFHATGHGVARGDGGGAGAGPGAPLPLGSPPRGVHERNVFGSRCARMPVAPFAPSSRRVPGLTSPAAPVRIGEVALEAVHPRRGAGGVDVRGGVGVNLVVRGGVDDGLRGDAAEGAVGVGGGDGGGARGGDEGRRATAGIPPAHAAGTGRCAAARETANAEEDAWRADAGGGREERRRAHRGGGAGDHVGDGRDKEARGKMEKSPSGRRREASGRSGSSGWGRTAVTGKMTRSGVRAKGRRERARGEL